jgi:hypothetical protein
MIERIIRVFEKNLPLDNRSDIWNWCLDHSSKVDVNEENLENMANTNLCYGFFGGTQDVNTDAETTDRATETALRMIEELLGFKVSLPQFTGGRRVLMTPRGIITDRHLHYLWILKRIINLFPDRNSSIIEIGAGLGILGYYLSEAGYKDYTSVDLATPSACQSYFLAKNLPYRDIILSGDKDDPFSFEWRESIKLLHASDFHHIEKDRFSIMINIDSLPEMVPTEVEKYTSDDCAKLLLSINTRDVVVPYRTRVYRVPFYLRDGYYEELFQL